MELTVMGSLRGALGVLGRAEISLQDSEMYAPESEMHSLYLESAAICSDFARAHLRQARYMASRSLEFTEIFRELRGEPFGERIDEYIDHLTSPRLQGLESVMGAGVPNTDATEACIAGVEDLTAEIAELVAEGYLAEEP